jgi:hypothetical protein
VQLGWNEKHAGSVFYQKLTMRCRGRRRERIHCEKPVSILNGVCDISSKIWGRRAVENVDGFDSGVGCRCCALLETDEMLCGTLKAGGHRA